MDGTIEVTLVTAIWREPRVFAGAFDVQELGNAASAHYTFRVETSGEEYRFTTLRGPGASGGEAITPLHPTAVEILTTALRGAVELLSEREQKRFEEGRTGESTPCTLDDFGFRVQFPFHPADEEVASAFAGMLGRRGSPAEQEKLS
jgi:hypothetical protein